MLRRKFLEMPEYKNQPKAIIGYCSYIPKGETKACNKEFNGPRHQRYCSEHANPSTRHRVRIYKTDPCIFNQIIEHKSINSSCIMQKCQLEGCHNEFKLTLLPHTYVYPKYCESHRTEYRRKYFLTKLNKDKVCKHY